MRGLKSIPTNVVNPDNQAAMKGPLGPTQVLINVSIIARPSRVTIVVRSVCVMPQVAWPIYLLTKIFVPTTDNAKVKALNIDNPERH